MVKKFVDGLAFGAGFSLAFFALYYLAALLMMPDLTSGAVHTSYADSDAYDFGELREHIVPDFSSLTLEEKIDKASAIALVRYEPTSSKKVKAVVSEILKQKAGVQFYYQVGDEYPDGSYYIREGYDRGEGLVAFFTGSPAHVRMSLNYSDGRIGGLGDMPLQLFREQVKEAVANE